MRHPDSRHLRSAFTLIELLVVIGIIVIIAAISLPAMKSIGGGRNLENAGQLLLDQWNLARQEAVTRNRTVELRFYKFKDAQELAKVAEFRAFQFFLVEMDGSSREALSKIIYLPSGIIICEDPQMTSIVTLTEMTPTVSDPKVPAEDGYRYLSINFYPDGSTDLPLEVESSPGNWEKAKHFITLRQRNDPGVPPKNYFNILIEPTNGRLQSFRP